MPDELEALTSWLDRNKSNPVLPEAKLRGYTKVRQYEEDPDAEAKMHYSAECRQAQNVIAMSALYHSKCNYVFQGLGFGVWAVKLATAVAVLGSDFSRSYCSCSC